MDDIYFKKVLTTIILSVLIILSFFLLKPILLSIVFGFILAFIFSPVYNWILGKVKNTDVAASIVCIFLILLIVLPVWFLTPIVLNESIKIFKVSQQLDYVSVLKKIFPDIFASEEFSAEIGSAIHSFATKITNSLMNSVSQIILNFPTISLHFLVIFFTFYFTLRDKQKLVEYIQSLLPFSKDVEKKLFDHSKDITQAVLYGQIVIGLLQGIIAGLGFFIFRAPNALTLTLLAGLAGIFPIVGTAVIWLPISIYFFVAGNSFAAFGILIFGIISSTIDNLLRPIIVSKRTKIPTSLVVIGMVGGLFLFGIIGLIIGPLILAYLLVVMELYRRKDSPQIFVKEN
ncbi:MAG: AI-2E family transporter [Nanoarchaeota archaeon]